MDRQNTYRLGRMQKVYCFIKSIIDFFIALLAIIVLLPLFIVVAVAIKIDSPGPVFFVQKRIGKGGRLFGCVKFRSMSLEARPDVAGYEYDDVQSYVTRVGNFIRKFSIDELPQLFNVLTFRMSLIGFRPSQPCEKVLNDARESYGMYQIRPGISGWAQVNGRDILAASPKRKAEFDRYYLMHISPWLDLKILFLTVGKVIRRHDVVEGVVKGHEHDADKVSAIVTDADESKKKEAV